jgi:hypothetical protein
MRKAAAEDAAEAISLWNDVGSPVQPPRTIRLNRMLGTVYRTSGPGATGVSRAPPVVCPPWLWYDESFWVSGNNSVVECDLAKVEVAGSNPVSRSNLRPPDTRAGYGWRANLRAKVGGVTLVMTRL